MKRPLIEAVCIMALLCVLVSISAGCLINSNEYIPITPTAIIYDAQGNCLVTVEGVAYNTRGADFTHRGVCDQLKLNQTNWVKFCPEFTMFPICEVRP